MKTTVTACLLAFFLLPLASQQTQNADSLIKVLNTQKLSRAEEIRVCEQLCFIFQNSDIEKTVEYAKRGEVLAEQEKDEPRIMRFNHFIGSGYRILGKFDSAYIHLEKSLELSVKTENRKSEANLYNTIATTYKDQEKYTEAINYYLKAIALAEELDDKLTQGMSLVNIATIHRALNNNERSLYYLEQAEKIADEKGYAYLNAGACHAIGNIYIDERDREKALHYMQKALEFSHSIGDMQYMILSNQGISIIYCDEYKDYDKALEYALETQRLAAEFGIAPLIVAAWNVLSNIYLEQKRYKECKEAAFKAWQLDSISREEATNISLNLALSNIYLGNKNEAAYFLRKNQDIITQNNDKNFRETLLSMEVRFETEKKEMHIATLEKEKELYIWLGVAVVAILLLAFGLLLIRHRLNVEKRKMAEQQIGKLEQEKQLIATQAVLDGETAERSRLARDLHDGLGGMLSVIRLNLRDIKSHSDLEDPDGIRFNKALGMLDESIGELRRVAHHIMPESLMRYGLKVSIEDLCLAIPGAHFQYLGSDSRLDSQLEVLIYRCAYELINNAVKHANATDINVQLMIDSGVISLTVQDNGAGFDPDSITPGAGLENIRTRVSAYNGKMNIYSSPGHGTEIAIEIEPS